MTDYTSEDAPILIATTQDALENGVLPIRTIRSCIQHPLDAGIDLPLAHTTVLQPGEPATLGTGHVFSIPTGWVGLIRLRGSTNQLHLLAGVVDPDYTGAVFLNLQNLAPEPVTLKQKQRSAQSLFVPVNTNLLFSSAEEVEAIGSFRQASRLASTGS
jgi:dUTP pyrophosphatase